MSVDFLYFDLGNVLLSFSHERMFRQMAEEAGVDIDCVRRAIQAPLTDGGQSMQMQFEAGLMDVDDVYDHFCRATGTQPDRDALFNAASEIFDPIDDSVALIRSLHGAGNRLGVLSNTNEADWTFVTSGRFPFLQECFHAYALSFEARSMKPEREVFDYAVERAGAPAGNVFFTDDKPENVAGALAAGLDAVLFQSAEQLRGELVQRDVAGA